MPFVAAHKRACMVPRVYAHQGRHIIQQEIPGIFSDNATNRIPPVQLGLAQGQVADNDRACLRTTNDGLDKAQIVLCRVFNVFKFPDCMALAIKRTREILQWNPLFTGFNRCRVDLYKLGLCERIPVADVYRILLARSFVRFDLIAAVSSQGVICPNIIFQFAASVAFCSTPHFEGPVHNRGKSVQFIGRRNGIAAVV